MSLLPQFHPYKLQKSRPDFLDGPSTQRLNVTFSQVPEPLGNSHFLVLQSYTYPMATSFSNGHILIFHQTAEPNFRKCSHEPLILSFTLPCSWLFCLKLLCHFCYCPSQASTWKYQNNYLWSPTYFGQSRLRDIQGRLMREVSAHVVPCFYRSHIVPSQCLCTYWSVAEMGRILLTWTLTTVLGEEIRNA